jgi:hypothetical protein
MWSNDARSMIGLVSRGWERNIMQRIFSLPVAVVAPRLSPNSVRRVRQAKNPLHNGELHITSM